VGHHTEAFIGIDTSKSRNAVAIAEGGRGGEVRFLGEFPATEAAMRKLIAKLGAKYSRLTFCYEAGPTGYGLYRLIKSLGHECIVAAPSLIPKKPGDRVKTNRRDAVGLTKLLRADELTAVWVPDERHEAMRDLSRARLAAKKDLQGKRQQISSLMLRQLLSGQDDVGTGPHEVADVAKARVSRATYSSRRASSRHPPRRRARGALGASDPRCGARMVACRGRHGPASDARDRSHCRRGDIGRDR
jgi:transposase